MKMERKILSVASVLGVVAIILGAFGAHALKKILSVEQLNTFETGVKYQMYHALLLLFIATTPLLADKAKKGILYLVVVGILFFSGSIYLLATNDLTSFDFRVIGFVTPIGGLLLICSWVWLFVEVYKKAKH
jgi:uncharacterized membrane protein YgdD (TMEM256/DUF423 family)